MLLRILSHWQRKTFRCVRDIHVSAKHKTTNKTGETDEPVRFSKSKAYNYRSADTFASPTRNVPWYQPVSVLSSTVAFLLYFCVFREESDWDLEVTESLYSRMPGLEEKQIEQRILWDKSHGNNTQELEARLGEIRQQK